MKEAHHTIFYTGSCKKGRKKTRPTSFSCSLVVYIYASLFHLAVESHDLYQDEKKICCYKLSKFTKLQQFSPKMILLSFCEFAQLVTTAFLFLP